MKHVFCAILTAGAVVLGTALPAIADSDKQAKICAAAEDRFVEMFGYPSAEEEGVRVVTMYKYSFCPAQITVPVGTIVRWVNVDKRTSHSVIVPDEPESDRAFPGESVEFIFLTPGDNQYLCGPHWETRDMIGMVTVEP